MLGRRQEPGSGTGWAIRTRPGTSSCRPPPWPSSTGNQSRPSRLDRRLGRLPRRPRAAPQHLQGRKNVAKPVVMRGGACTASTCFAAQARFRRPGLAGDRVRFRRHLEITSQAWSQERMNQYLPDNPQILLGESRYRGYTCAWTSRPSAGAPTCASWKPCSAAMRLAARSLPTWSKTESRGRNDREPRYPGRTLPTRESSSRRTSSM